MASLTDVNELIKINSSKSTYTGVDKSKGSAYNSWRSIRHTAKGKDIGSPDEWQKFEVFMEEVQGEWCKGKIVIRIDKSLPHSSANSMWADKGAESIGKLTKLEYKSETKTLVEWCAQYDLNYNGVRQRYFKGKNLTPHEILFGKTKIVRSKVDRDADHRLSRKLGAYRLSDNRKGFICDVTMDDFRRIIKNGCIYCGYEGSIGLDRIDNSKGHELTNVVACCYECNCARNNNFSHEEMFLLGESIKEIRRRRNENKEI